VVIKLLNCRIGERKVRVLKIFEDLAEYSEIEIALDSADLYRKIHALTVHIENVFLKSFVWG